MVKQRLALDFAGFRVQMKKCPYTSVQAVRNVFGKCAAAAANWG
jgi:hypothetical protein